MLTDFLRKQPMAELLKGGTRVLYPPASDRRAWDGVAAEYRTEIRKLAEKYAGIPYPARTALQQFAHRMLL